MRCWRSIGVALTLGGLAGALLLPQGAVAAPVSFRASVDRDRVEIGETLTLEVVVTVPDPSRIEKLEMPGYQEGFDLVSTSTSTQMSFTFGTGGQSLQRTEVHSLTLQAIQTGVQTITPGTLRYAGHVYRTEPIRVMVLKTGQGGGGSAPSQARPRAAPPGQQPFDPFDPFAGFDPFGFFGGTQAVGDEDIFVRLAVDKHEVVVGDQVTLWMQVFSRVEISNFARHELPKFDGFWVEDLESPTRVAPTIKYIRGVPYRAYLLGRKALFPTRAGTLRIGAAEIEVATGFGFFRSGRTITRRSRPFTIEVRPLPAKGKPQGFPPLNVGRWRLSASVSSPRVRLGDTVTLRLVAQGTGNLHSLEMPALHAIDGFRVYDPSETLKPLIRNHRFGGAKTVEIVLVPERTGTLHIPSVEMPVYDPVEGRYERLRTDPIAVEVEVGPSGAGHAPVASGQGAAPAAPSNVLDPEGLRTIRYTSRIHRVEPDPWHRPLFAWGIVIPLALYLVVSVFERVRASLRRRAGSDAGRRAQAIARRKLKAARRARRKGALREAFAETERALLEYLAEKTGIPARGMPRFELAARLVALGYAQATVDTLTDVLERVETQRYAPVEPTREAVDALIEEATRTLAALEDGPTRPMEAAA